LFDALPKLPPMDDHKADIRGNVTKAECFFKGNHMPVR
jgi:hypothetical protein